MATQRQTWALFCGTGLDCRNIKNLTVDQASDLISQMKDGLDIIDTLICLGATGTPKKARLDFDKVWQEAHEAGMVKASECIPTPMVVQQRANPMDDQSEVIKTYAPVMDGVCGFAWISGIKGNTAFGKWAKDKRLASKDYPSGLRIWIGLFGQSMQKKEAYAHGAATVLNQYGIKCYVNSRMD
jgi:hypothetical protein